MQRRCQLVYSGRVQHRSRNAQRGMACSDDLKRKEASGMSVPIRRSPQWPRRLVIALLLLPLAAAMLLARGLAAEGKVTARRALSVGGSTYFITLSRASAKRRFSPAVPTVTRRQVGRPNDPQGRTSTPCRSNWSKTSVAGRPTSNRMKLA